MWFEDLTGFKEVNPDQVRENLELQDNFLISKVNGKKYDIGQFHLLSLEELRKQAPPLGAYQGEIKIKEVCGDVSHFHVSPEESGALFQAASQFNLLEMVGPDITPERGVGIYEHDYTQAPACAIACGAGTIYRNYFVKVGDQIGQSVSNQIDCLDEIGIALGNTKSKLWTMSNGYALANIDGLAIVSEQIKNLNELEYEELKDLLKVGIHFDAQVTLAPASHSVSQIYCSALPVGYSNISPDKWEVFARLILEATYEATFYAGLINFERTGNNKIFLTLVGGGVFGNSYDLIFDAIRRSMLKFSNLPLDIKILSYGSSDPRVQQFISSFD